MRAMLILGLMSLCGACFAQQARPQDKNQPAKNAERLDAFETMLGTGSTLAEWRAWWNTMLDAQIRGDSRRYQLTAEERRELKTAGTEELKRMIDRLETARQEFDALKDDAGEREKFLDAARRMLRVEVQRWPFDTNSIYDKIIRHMKASRALRFSLSPDRI